MTQIQESDIKNVANLARISLSDVDITKFTHDIQSIMGFIDTVNSVEVSGDLLKQEGFAPINNIREDIEYTNTYITPQELIQAAPKNQDNAVKVKKIIGSEEE